jgi:hypothetical protein
VTTGSGDAEVVVLRGRLSLLVGELREPDGSNEVPVAPDGAALDPHPTEAYCLQRPARDPDRREEMASPATNDDVPAYSVPTTGEDNCLTRKCEDCCRQGNPSAPAAGGGAVRLRRGRSVVGRHGLTPFPCTAPHDRRSRSQDVFDRSELHVELAPTSTDRGWRPEPAFGNVSRMERLRGAEWN